MDYYKSLNVSKTASQDEIKKAFRRAAMEHHPDKGGDPNKFKEINEAYETLSDPAKRQAYDNPQPRFDTNFNNNFGGHPFGDVFTEFFRKAHARNHPQFKNRDITVQTAITLKDVILGTNVYVTYATSNGKNEYLNVEIPAGAKDGDTVKYANLGDNADPRLPRGDLYVKVRVKRDSVWERDGNNIITTKTIDIFDLMTGVVILIVTPDNRKLDLTVPAGTKPGKILSIKGYGIPDLRTKRRGDAYVQIDCSIPVIKNSQTIDEIRKLIKDME
jgi:curved DNA-binding protein